MKLFTVWLGLCLPFSQAFCHKARKLRTQQDFSHSLRSVPVGGGFADAHQVSRDEFDDVVMKTYGRYPITMVKGRGVKLWDSTGKEYLDFVAGISTCCLGHAHIGLVAAVEEQIKTVHHVSNLYYIPQQGALAKWLVQRSPMDRVFFCNSGAEANEAAIKLARKYAHTKLGHIQRLREVLV